MNVGMGDCPWSAERPGLLWAASVAAAGAASRLCGTARQLLGRTLGMSWTEVDALHHALSFTAS